MYRVYDEDDALLYVGVTRWVPGRMAQHQQQSPWFFRAARVEWDAWPSRFSALGEESRLIRDLLPLYNRAGTTGVAPIPLRPVPWNELPPAEKARQATVAHRRLALGDRI